MTRPRPDTPLRAADGLWAITAYFNPAGYRRRLKNYHLFRERLTVPLVTVELSFNGRFELATGDAEVVVQLHGGDVMWQKERLLDVALQHLPSRATPSRGSTATSSSAPATDIARDAQGPWRWSSAKPDLHAAIGRYFESRREDGPAD